jgi:acetate---CoA ligase (ADP-forming)
MARTAEEAAALAGWFEGPVAVKLASTTLTHKSDVGGVRLRVRGAAGVRAAFHEIAERIGALGRREEMAGVLVQEMVEGGVETFMGVTHDPAFGPLIGFGLGGIHVEVWRDVVFRVHPLTRTDARDMVGQIRGTRLLDGVRGAPASDREALVEAILRLDRLVGEHPAVLEIDLNPLLALPPGQGALVLDARVRVGQPEKAPSS